MLKFSCVLSPTVDNKPRYYPAGTAWPRRFRRARFESSPASPGATSTPPRRLCLLPLLDLLQQAPRGPRITSASLSSRLLRLADVIRGPGRHETDALTDLRSDLPESAHTVTPPPVQVRMRTGTMSKRVPSSPMAARLDKVAATKNGGQARKWEFA
eukprot:COSAG03_NODE_146_length_11610_cov_7.478586_3_plen_156_part_00